MTNEWCNFGITISLTRWSIFVVGGDESLNDSTNTCEVYNIDENRWEDLPDLSFPRSNNSLCIFNDNYLYSFGGF